MFTITKSFSFCASHQLRGLSADHPCSRLHGHNFEVILELKSADLNDVGFVRDYRKLYLFKAMLDREFDHRHLNDLVPFNPTAENLARHLFLTNKDLIPELVAVTVKETEKTSARYERD